MRLGQLPALAVIRQQLPRHVTDTGVQRQEPTGEAGGSTVTCRRQELSKLTHNYSRFDLPQEARQVRDSIPTAQTSLPTPQVAHDPQITLEIIYFSARATRGHVQIPRANHPACSRSQRW